MARFGAAIKAFESIGDAGFVVGEFCGARFVRNAIEKLGDQRIQHGVRAIEDPEVVAMLRDTGIALDVCPISFGNSIEDEYEFLAGELGFSEKDLARVAANGFQVALKKN